jgi:succinyl-CoA synthetase alpha subunit
MSILIDDKTRLLVQGITGHEGLFHTRKMYDYGGNVVAGVTPGKGGEWVLEGKIPVFDSVKRAVNTTGANVSVIFVPAQSTLDAIFEAANSGISLIICVTEGIPLKDIVLARQFLLQKGSRLIGPNCPGVLSPGIAKAGIIPGDIVSPGTVGVVSRSGTLTYEVLFALANAEIGVSTCVGIGGDQVLGTNFVEILRMFEADPYTEQVILVGEIGGRDEEEAAAFIAREMTKPVIAFIAGQSAPTGKTMGHVGAIIDGESGKAGSKIKAFWDAGVRIASVPEEIPKFLSR